MTELSLSRFKRCSKCGCTKLATTEFFPKKYNGRYGLRADCKTCRNAYLRTDKSKAAARKRYHNDAERKRAHARRYRRDNKAAVLEKDRQRHRQNKESKTAKRRAYYTNNKDLFLALNRRRKARLKNNETEFYSVEDLNAMWHEQKGCCYYCGTPLFAHYHIEHKQPVSRGGADALWNICLACPTCNLRKHDKTEAEFVAVLAAEMR